MAEFFILQLEGKKTEINYAKLLSTYKYGQNNFAEQSGDRESIEDAEEESNVVFCDEPTAQVSLLLLAVHSAFYVKRKTLRYSSWWSTKR